MKLRVQQRKSMLSACQYWMLSTQVRSYILMKHVGGFSDVVVCCTSTQKSTQVRKCTSVGKAFMTHQYWRVMKIHTGDKPHSCKTCWRDFRHRGDLKIHMRVHTGEKLHPCTPLGKDSVGCQTWKAIWKFILMWSCIFAKHEGELSDLVVTWQSTWRTYTATPVGKYVWVEKSY